MGNGRIIGILLPQNWCKVQFSILKNWPKSKFDQSCLKFLTKFLTIKFGQNWNFGNSKKESLDLVHCTQFLSLIFWSISGSSTRTLEYACDDSQFRGTKDYLLLSGKYQKITWNQFHEIMVYYTKKTEYLVPFWKDLYQMSQCGKPRNSLSLKKYFMTSSLQ